MLCVEVVASGAAAVVAVGLPVLLTGGQTSWEASGVRSGGTDRRCA